MDERSRTFEMRQKEREREKLELEIEKERQKELRERERVEQELMKRINSNISMESDDKNDIKAELQTEKNRIVLLRQLAQRDIVKSELIIKDTSRSRVSIMSNKASLDKYYNTMQTASRKDELGDLSSKKRELQQRSKKLEMLSKNLRNIKNIKELEKLESLLSSISQPNVRDNTDLKKGGSLPVIKSSHQTEVNYE